MKVTPFLSLLGGLALSAFPLSKAEDPIVVYYYTQWAVWARKFCAAQFSQDIPPEWNFPGKKFRGTTHVQYAFHAPNFSKGCIIETKDIEADQGGDGGWMLDCEKLCPNIPGESPSPDRGSIACIRKMAGEQGFEFGISLGGWTLSTDFSDCVTDPALRAAMVESIISEIGIHSWNFIDFDWEYPDGGGNDGPDVGRPTDWDNFQLLVTELREALSSNGLSGVGIAGAFGMNPHLIEGTKDYTNPTPMSWLCENLDYVSLMSYDLMGGWVPQTGWPAPVYHDPAAPYEDADRLTIKWQLETWKAACQDNFKKVVLGLPSYGKSWQSVSPGPTNNGLYELCTNTGSGPPPYENMPCLGDGSFTDTGGTLELWDIEMNYNTSSSCTHYYHDVAKQDFMYCTGEMYYGMSDIWFAFDGTEVFFEKAKIAKEMGAGGWMHWEPAYTSMGDFPMDASVLHPSKNTAISENRPNVFSEYFWLPYENALFDAWNGLSIEPHRSKGIRIGAGGVENVVPVCDEVQTHSVDDGSVEESCMLVFCTHACNTFMSGACANEEPQAACVERQFRELPPAGANGITCTFNTVIP